MEAAGIMNLQENDTAVSLSYRIRSCVLDSKSGYMGSEQGKCIFASSVYRYCYQSRPWDFSECI